jgi:cell division transport system permease protein
MHLFFFREAWRSFNAHRGLAMTAIFSMTAALTLCGVLLLVSVNVRAALMAMGDRREMIVYLKDEADDAEVTALREKITQYYGSSTYVGRKEAWDEFKQQVGDPELLESVGTNPLPASLRVKLRPELQNFAAMDTCARQIGQFPEVEAVRYGAEWVRRLDQLYASAKRIAIGAGLLVALAVVFVLYNTLRLSVLARRHQVEIMARLGAGDRFVALPFVIEAVTQAGLSALLALGVVFGLQQALAPRLEGLAFLPLPWSLAFVGGTALLAWIASSLALGRILRTVGA